VCPPSEEALAECPECGVEYYGAPPSPGEVSRTTICSECREWFVVFDTESDE
jgi:hypothetical protein